MIRLNHDTRIKVQSLRRNSNSGNVTVFIALILVMVGVLFAGNNTSIKSSKNSIYEFQQKEALQELSQVVAIILSNETACRQFLTDSGLVNRNWNIPINQSIVPKFYNSGGAAGPSVASRIMLPNEIEQSPVFNLVNLRNHSTRTVLAYLRPRYSAVKGISFNTTEYEIPIFLEIDTAQRIQNCRATVKSTFDLSATVDDYLCKAFDQTGGNILYSFGLKTCETI